MKDSIEIYTMIRRWEDLRVKLIENMKLKQTSHGKDSTLAPESEQQSREESDQIAAAFLAESTDVEFIVTHSFPELKKAAAIDHIYIEENKLNFEGYEYYLYKDVLKDDHLQNKFNSLEEAVKEALRLTNSSLDVSDAIRSFYF